MPVPMGDDNGEKPMIALEKQVEEMRLTIAERDKRIRALEEQLAEARKDLDARDEAYIASPAPAPVAEDAKGGVKAFSTPVRGGLEWQATSVAKKLMKKQEEGVLASPNTRKACPNKLPKPSPDDPKPPKKSTKKKEGKGYPFL